MKICLLGPNGQIGTSIKNLLSNRFECHSITKNMLNCLNLDDVSNFFQNNIYDIIINCIAYTNVDEAEKNQKDSFILNAELPTKLSEIAKNKNISLLHFSTNYVYDGLKVNSYSENDIERPLNYYGTTKLIGDKAIISSNCKGAIFRLGWVYSINGNNFFNKIINNFNNNKTVYVVDDQFGSPTSSNFVAELINLFLKKNNINNLNKLKKYNVSPYGKINFFNLSKWIQNNLNLPNKSQILPVKSDNFKNVAARPINSYMSSDLISKTLSFEIPIWEKHAIKFIDEFNCNN